MANLVHLNNEVLNFVWMTDRAYVVLVTGLFVNAESLINVIVFVVILTASVL